MHLKFLQWYRILSILVLNTILLFVALNGSFYISFLILDTFRERSEERDYRNDLQRFAETHPGVPEDDLFDFWRENNQRLTGFEPFTQFKMRATSGRFINISDQGFRLVMNQGPWPPDPAAFNIFTFGGSTTFGMGVTDSQTIPSFLQELLFSTSHQPTFVYNFGRYSYFSTQERILFENLALTGAIPDVAIFIDGLNDFAYPNGEPFTTDQLREYVDKTNRDFANRDIWTGQEEDQDSWHAQVTALLRLLPMDRVNRYVAWKLKWWSGTYQTQVNDSEKQTIGAAPNIEKPQSVEFYAQPDDSLDVWDRIRMSIPEKDRELHTIINRWLANKILTEAVAEALDVETVFVWQPVSTYEYDQAGNWPTLRGYDTCCPALQRAELGYGIIQNMSATLELGDNFLWLADMQVGRNENLYIDPGHYSPAFHRNIASRIRDHLDQRGLLNLE